MSIQEQLFNVRFHNKRTNYQIYLLVWGVDAMDVIQQLQPVIGHGAEYALDSLAAHTVDGKPMYRAAE